MAGVPLLLLRNRFLRVSDDSLAGAGRGEPTNGAFHAVTLPTPSHRSHPIVISRLRLQTEDAHAENRLWMGPVEPDVRFRRLAQVTGIRAVMRNCEMFIVPARVGSGPPDDRQVVVGQLERWPLDDLNARGRLRWWKYLSGRWA